MSNTTKRAVSARKVIEDFLRCSGPSTFKGGKLSTRDDQAYKLALEYQAYLTLDLVSDRGSNSSRLIIPWLDAMVRCDVFELAVFLKSAVTLLRNYVDGDRYDYEHFKHVLRKDFSSCGDFLSPIKPEIVRFLAQPNRSDFAVINQFLSFMSRLSLRDADYSTDALEEYLATESRLMNLTHDYQLYRRLNLIIKDWFSAFTYEGFYPNHGNGSVATLTKKESSLRNKYQMLGSDALIDLFLSRLNLSFSDLSPLPYGKVERCCEVIFVPKSMTSFRTISKEPATLQYLQQGVWHQIDRFMRHHPILSRHIHIHDRSFNQRYAQRGSLDGSYATIDLSSASDSVSWVLAKSLFAGTPILDALFATRSTSALLPDGSKVLLRKFAPMGSALCFPIECIIFCAICELANRDSWRSHRQHDYVVFGDDLVIPLGQVSTTVDYLTRCGFLINRSKTFFNPHNPFRESCGGEYYLGSSVGPLRLSRKFSADRVGRHHPDSFQAAVDLANSGLAYGYLNLRSRVIRDLLELPECFVPKFSFDTRHLWSNSATNYHLRSIWFDWWQCHLSNYGEISSVEDPFERSPDDEAIRFFEWLRLTRDRPSLVFPDDRVSAVIGRKRSKLISVLDVVTSF